MKHLPIQTLLQEIPAKQRGVGEEAPLMKEQRSKEHQEVESDTQMTSKPRDNAHTNGLAFAQVTGADDTASGLGGGSHGRAKGAV